VVHPDGSVNRSAVATRVFSDPAEKVRLEQLIHPMVHEARARQMEAASKDPQVVAFVWDTPLLLEAGLAGQCDAIAFVDAPFEQRLARVKARSDWDEVELLRREKSQLALDSKRALSDYVITNTADAQAGDSAMAGLREQVRRVLSQILTGSTTTRRPAKRGWTFVGFWSRLATHRYRPAGAGGAWGASSKAAGRRKWCAWTSGRRRVYEKASPDERRLFGPGRAIHGKGARVCRMSRSCGVGFFSCQAGHGL